MTLDRRAVEADDACNAAHMEPVFSK
jgi:hypothetical protein